jgi:hypothetical protein
MKLTFEGPNFHSIRVQIQGLLDATKNISGDVSESPNMKGIPSAAPEDDEGPGPEATATAKGAGEKPVEKPVEKSKLDRVAAMNKARAAKKNAAAAPLVEEPGEEDPFTPPVDPADMVKIRQKTIEDLQSAYANGHQKEVFELLSRFGKGAKSFRELPADAFLPIREAIDKGALT